MLLVKRLYYNKYGSEITYAKAENKGVKVYIPMLYLESGPRLAKKIQCKRATEALEYHERTLAAHQLRHATNSLRKAEKK